MANRAAQPYGGVCWCVCFFVSLQTLLLLLCVSTPPPAAGTHLFPQHYTMMHWAGRIEKELEKVLQHVTGIQQMRSVG
ncbi:hypothetical protein CRUP_028288 [Coryphaenoides rupestris]|nr:hypothetical protein CRUP_028288 [Coryphaenoides rupestris]